MANISNNLTPNSDINMVFDPEDNIYDIGEGFEEERGCSLSFNIQKPRSPSISSSECSKDYHIHVKRMSDRMDKDKPINSIDSIKIEYVSQRKQKDQVSKATDNTNNMLQHVSNKVLASSTISSNSMFDIQLSYDIDQALNPKEWNSDFYATLLYKAMEHLVSDVKNIKDSLCRIGKYIWGKSIDSNSNNIKDLEGVGKAVWEFLSSIYSSHWNGLYVDEVNTTFRNKVKTKFTPQVPKFMNNNKSKEIVKPTFISSIPPPIPAKTQKEVNELSKYFKKNTNSQQKKLYANATSSLKQPSPATSKNITRETLKIKETFPNLLNKKIKEMQKVINSLKDKAKPKINMTTKSPSRKQVIVPMNNDIIKEFIKNSSSHIANINHALKTIKSNTIANFICVDSKGIVITTNNISLGSDLQKIEKYVKKFTIFWCWKCFFTQITAIKVIPQDCRYSIHEWKDKQSNFIRQYQKCSEEQPLVQQHCPHL